MDLVPKQQRNNIIVVYTGKLSTKSSFSCAIRIIVHGQSHEIMLFPIYMTFLGS